MRITRHRLSKVYVLLTIAALLVPSVSMGTVLFGHAYAMYYNRVPATPNFDTGIIYMWNGMVYVGSATIPGMAAGGPINLEIWETIREGMNNRRFTILFTNANPINACPFCNDGSTGVLDAFVVTIF
jgi:hypothetical protein